MFLAIRKLLTQARSLALANRPVLASADIVRRGQYVPRGATGRILRVRPDGAYEVRFDRPEAESVIVRPGEIAPAPTLARRAPFGLRILSH